jgi:DNA-binding NarL/FixJ family response regulator
MSDERTAFGNGHAAAAPGTARIRCIVVDDHPAVRTGLRELLAIEPGLMVLEAFSTAESALGFAEGHEIDVAIVDYQLGGRSGLWLSRRLQELSDPPAVLIYSAFSDWLLSAACVVAQASGLVSKTVLGDELAMRIREAAAGARRLPVVAPALSEMLRRRFDPDEQAIYGMLASGISADEISRTLRMRPGDVDATLWTMLRKLERVERGDDGRGV